MITTSTSRPPKLHRKYIQANRENSTTYSYPDWNRYWLFHHNLSSSTKTPASNDKSGLSWLDPCESHSVKGEGAKPERRYEASGKSKGMVGLVDCGLSGGLLGGSRSSRICATVMPVSLSRLALSTTRCRSSVDSLRSAGVDLPEGKPKPLQVIPCFWHRLHFPSAGSHTH